MRLAVPDRSSQYQVLGHLASGGMGEILLARRVGPAGFEKLVVLKRALAQVRGSPDIIRGLIEEARLLARINHPNVCHVHGLEQADGELFLELEYLEGLSLWSILTAIDEANERIAPPILCALFEQACDGLDAIHSLRTRDGSQANVVHRDVSPGNLFVTETGLVKVLDLGIAKSSDSEELTPYGRVKGKWPYVSPEQASGLPVDARADLFALGLVMYDVARGRRPRSDRIGALAAETLDLAEVPHELARVIARATAPAREERFVSAAQMRAALRDAAASLGGSVDRATIASWLRDQFADAIARCRGRELARGAGADTELRTNTLVISAAPSEVALGTEAPPPAVTSQTQRLEIEGRQSLVAIEQQPVRVPLIVSADPEPLRRVRPTKWWVVGAASAVAVGVLLALGVGRAPATKRSVAPERVVVSERADAAAALSGGSAVVTMAADKPMPSVQPEKQAADASVPAKVSSKKTAPSRRSKQSRQLTSLHHADAPSDSTKSSNSSENLGPMGRLTLDSDPWANVTIAGRVLTTPIWGEALPPGKYKAIATTDDGRKRVLDITIEPGRELKYGRIDWSKP